MTGPLASLHIRREQFHLAWDRSIEPIATVASGDVVEFDALDASCGQITASSTVADIATLDFSRVDQVNGPIAVEGAEAGDRRSGRATLRHRRRLRQGHAAGRASGRLTDDRERRDGAVRHG